MEGVTGMMAWLSHVPGCSRGGLYGPENIDFRFVSELPLQRARLCDFARTAPATLWEKLHMCRPLRLK